MARVTVEDCVEKVKNRFDLVMMASHRSRQIAAGGELTVERDHDKNSVVSLREIAGETISLNDVQDSMIEAMQKYLPGDEPEEELLDLLAEEESVAGHEQQQKELESLAVDDDISDDDQEEITAEESVVAED